MSGKSDSNIQNRLSTLKQKQDKWMKERNIALTANQHKSSPRTTSISKLNTPNTQKTPSNNSVKKKTSQTLSWTNSPGGSTSEFVVRRNSGRLTNRSTASTKSNKNTPLTANSNKNATKSSKLENTDRRKTPIKDDSASYHDDSISSEDESVDLSAKINKYLSTSEVHGQSIKNDIYNVNSIPNQRTSSPETLSSHLCALCQNHMLSTQHAPHLVIPCAHSFCYSCVNQEKYCPTCRVNIMSVQKNVALHEIIKQYEKQKQAKLEERRKVEIKKYFDEYNSIETRVDLMKGKGAFSTCVCVCVCVCLCVRPFTVKTSPVWISLTVWEQINDVVLKTFHSVQPPFCRGGLSLQPNFQKGGLDRTSTFRGGLLGKRG